MAITIPTFNQPTVQAQAAPNVRIDPGASPESFGSGGAFKEGQQVSSGLFDQSQKIYAEEKHKADEVILTDVNSKLTRLKNQLIYDPKDGLMNRKGKDAFAAPDDLHAKYDSQAEALTKDLSPSQQEMAKHMVIGHKSDLDSDIQKHVFAESKAYDDETTQAAMDAAHDDAVTNFHEPDKINAALDAQHGTVLRWAQRQGIPESDPIVKQKLEDAASKTHSAIVERMLANGEDLKAKAYYDHVKEMPGQIKGDDMKILDKALEEGSVRGESVRISQDLTKKYPNDMRAALNETDSIKDPKVLEETRRRIKERYNDNDAALKMTNEKNSVSALNIIDQSKNIDDVMKSPMWKNFTHSERAGLISYAEAKRKGTQPETNWDDFYNLKTMAAETTTRDKFLQTNLMEYRPHMADGEFKQLVDLQADLRKGDEKAGAHLDGFRSDQDIVNGALSDAGIDHSAKPGTEEAKRVNLFKSKVDKEVMRIQTDTKKKVTNEDLKRIVDQYMIEGATDKGIFGSGFFASKKRLFEIDPTQDKQFTIDAKVPSEERAKIEAALKKHGLPVTDEAVLNLYKKKVGGLVGQ